MALQQQRPRSSDAVRVEPVSNDSVATRPRLPHETRRLSDGHVDGVEAVRHREDAIDAKLKFGKGWKSR